MSNILSKIGNRSFPKADIRQYFFVVDSVNEWVVKTEATKVPAEKEKIEIFMQRQKAEYDRKKDDLARIPPSTADQRCWKELHRYRERLVYKDLTVFSEVVDTINEDGTVAARKSIFPGKFPI